MTTHTQMLFTTSQLAQRWGRSEVLISLASAVGTGPQFIKVDGQIVYPQDEVYRYERACLFFDPAEVALQELRMPQ